MEAALAFVLANWEWFLLGFYIVEKVVKLTPTKKDDVIFDVIIKPIWSKVFVKRASLPVVLGSK